MEIAREVAPALVTRDQTVSFSRLIGVCMIEAFVEEWPESAKTRALRRADKLLNTVGYITDDEQRVE